MDKTEEFRKLVNEEVILPLNPIVKWDRYAIGDDYGFIFGWIDRDDGKKDFVDVQFWINKEDGKFYCSDTTSSTKYSLAISNCLKEGEHSDCKSARDFPDANLVEWQKAETSAQAPLGAEATEYPPSQGNSDGVGADAPKHPDLKGAGLQGV